MVDRIQNLGPSYDDSISQREPTMREKDITALRNFIEQNNLTDYVPGLETLPEGLYGDPNADGVLQSLGIGDFIPVPSLNTGINYGLVYGGQEALRDVEAAETATDYIAPGVTLGLGALEAFPFLKFATKPLTSFLKGIGSKIDNIEADVGTRSVDEIEADLSPETAEAYNTIRAQRTLNEIERRRTNPNPYRFTTAIPRADEPLITGAPMPSRVAEPQINDNEIGALANVPEREVSSLGFFSQALEAVRNLKQDKGTGQQFRKMLENAGVKPDEIKFTRELDELLSRDIVTKAQLLEVIERRPLTKNMLEYESNVVSPEFEGMNFPAQAEQLDIYQAYGTEYIDEQVDKILTGAFGDGDIDEVASMLSSDKYTTQEMESIAEKVQKGGLESVDAETQIDLQQAAQNLVEERYQYEPVFELQDPDTGYRIVGSNDMGFDVYNEGGSVINNVGSLNEARIVAEESAIDRGFIGFPDEGDVLFGDPAYRELGGENYKETRLTVNNYEGQTKNFTKGHFEEPNVVVHLRTTERKAAGDAEDVLYVEEMQSDWGQQGRDGFEGSEKARARVDAQLDEVDQLRADRRKLNDEAKAYYEDYKKGPAGKAFSQPLSSDELLEVDPDYKDIVEEFKLVDSAYNRAMNKLNSLQYANLPPLGPFVGSSEKFAEIGIKRLLIKAVNDGQKYVSFSSGDVQFDRWNEEGLITFYDKIIPKVGKKVAKRLDPEAIAGPVQIRMDHTVDVSVKEPRFTIEITPKMKEAIQKGLPLFTAPVVATAGALRSLPSDDNGDKVVE
jgi:hypothetical protein